MTIYTGTAYLFRMTPLSPDPLDPEMAEYRERVRAVSKRHKVSYGYVGMKVRDLDGHAPEELGGFVYLRNLDAARAFVDELKAEGVYDLGARCHSEYRTTVYWPTMIPNAQDAWDPEKKVFRQGAFVVFASSPDMSQASRFAPYITALKALYDRYGYRLLYTGQKAFDVIGAAPQRQVGIGLFPSIEEALACHQDPAYEEVRRLREGLLVDFQMTLFGPPA